MISRLDRYIIRTVTSTTLVILFALLCMDFFIQIMNELDDVGKGQYSLLSALGYVFLILPRDIYQFFPMAGLIGCLMGLGLLASNSELVVMRAAGLSIQQISLAVLKGILAMTLVITLFGEGLGPPMLLKAEQFKTMEKTNGQALVTQQGFWLRDGNDFIHVERVESTHLLQGLTRYQFDDQHHLIQVSYADKAIYQSNHWIIQTIQASRFSSDGHVQMQAFNETIWPMNLNPTVLKIAQVDPEEMNLVKLHEWIHYRKINQLRYSNDALVFWQRIFQPLATAVMMLLALPFIFGPLRSASTGLRLVTGIIVGFSFYILNQILGTLSVTYQFPPISGALFPIVLFGGIYVYFMRKM